MKTLFTLLFTLVLCATGIAKPAAEQKKSETQKFSGLQLKGQLKKPDLSYIYKRKGLRAEQIVNIPENFNEEIIEGQGQF